MPNEIKTRSNNIRSILESRMHQSFTVAADELLQRGYLERDERIKLSGLIGEMLEGFGDKVAVGEKIVDADDVEAIANKTAEQEIVMPEEFVEKPEKEQKDNLKDTSMEGELIEKRHLDSRVPWDGSSNPGPRVPFGVKGFAELDAAEDAEQAADDIRDDSEKLVQIVRNILNDPDDDKKAETIAKVSSEFSDRAADRSDVIKSGDTILGGVVETLKSVIADHTKQTCKTEGGVCYPAKDYAFVPADGREKPSTWKLRLSQGRPGNITKAQLGRAAAAFSSGGFRGEKVKIPSANVASVKARIRREYRKLGVDVEDIPNSVKSETAFMVWKDKSGRYVWLAKYSNNFRDDDVPPEIISAKSHQDFTNAVNIGKYDYPELRLWHRPEWIIGKSTWLAYDDTGFALAAGFFNDGMEGVAESLVKSSDLGVSHGMPKQYLRRDETDRTIITQHVTKEISILPQWSAANRWTEFIVIDDSNKENDMSIPDDLKVQAKEAFGLDDNVISQIEEANAKSAAKNRELGVEFKDKAEDSDPDSGSEDAKSDETETTIPASTEADTDKQDDKSVDPDAPPSRKEVAKAIIELQPLIVKQVVSSVIEKLTPFMDAVKELARDDDERLRDKTAATPRVSSLGDMLKDSFSALDEGDGLTDKEADELGKPKHAKTNASGDGTFIGALVAGEGDEYLANVIKESADN